MGGQCSRFCFKGQGDVATFAPLALEGKHAVGKSVQRRLGLVIHQTLIGELRKASVNPRRFAVFNGVAENAVRVHANQSIMGFADWVLSELKRSFFEVPTCWFLAFHRAQSESVTPPPIGPLDASFLA